MTPAELSRGGGETRVRRWALIVVGVLVVQATVIVAMVVVATRDPSFAVEPDYYEKAMRWDDEARGRAHARELGWKAEAGFRGGAGAGETLLVALKDRAGAPIEGVSVDAEYFHQARSGDRKTAVLGASGLGRYEAPVGGVRAGVYEVRLTVSRGTERVSLVTSAMCPRGGAP